MGSGVGFYEGYIVYACRRGLLSPKRMLRIHAQNAPGPPLYGINEAGTAGQGQLTPCILTPF